MATRVKICSQSSGVRRKRTKTPVKDELTSKERTYIAIRIRDNWTEVMLHLGLQRHEIDEMQFENMDRGIRACKIAALNKAFDKIGKNPGILDILEHALTETCNKITFDEYKQEFNIVHPKKKERKTVNQTEQTMPANTCAVAGIKKQYGPSTLLSLNGQVSKCSSPIRLSVRALSNLIPYDETDLDVRLSALFEDGKTVIKGVAFGTSAIKWSSKINENGAYEFQDYSIKLTDEIFERTEFQLLLHENSTYNTISPEGLKTPEERKYMVSELKDEDLEKLLVSTSPVIVLEVGEMFQPNKKYLREIYVADTSGFVKVAIWSSRHEDFEFQKGESISLRYFKLDQFDGEFYLEKCDVSKIIKCHINETDTENIFSHNNVINLSFKTMSLFEINEDVDNTRHNIIIKEATIKRFKKDDNMLIYKQCVVKNHGKMAVLSNGRFRCERCKKTYKVGIDIVQLVAQIDDGSTEELPWVLIYTNTAKIILGDDFEIFMEHDTKRVERSALMEKVRRKCWRYKFHLKVVCDVDDTDNNKRIVVKNIERV